MTRPSHSRPPAAPTTAAGGEGHWNAVYAGRPVNQLSWFAEPATSLRLVTTAVPPSAGVVDVGGGTATLVDRLLDRGFSDLTVIDLSTTALDHVAARLGADAANVTLIPGDVLSWQPGRSFDLWHDRAVFHFLVNPADRDRYISTAVHAVRSGGTLILGVFGPDGPTSCSGLPTARYHPTELAALFAPHADLQHAEREQHTTPSGHIQSFTWVTLARR